MSEQIDDNVGATVSGGQSPPPQGALVRWLIYSVISVALIGLGWYLLRKAGLDWGELWDLATNRDELQELIGRAGAYAPLVCIAMQFIQVVIFFIPGEVTQMVAGLVFGTFWGFVYSVIGLVLGSVFNFYVARKLGRPFVEKIVDIKTIQKVDTFMSARKGRTAIALMFLMPGFPKDALCYIVGGATSVSYMTFFWISSLGRAPALLFSVMFGDKIGDGDTSYLVVLGVIFAAFLLFGWWWKKNTPHLESQ